MASIAAVEQFGLFVVSNRQIEPLGQSCKGRDLPFSHGSAATGGGTPSTERNETRLYTVFPVNGRTYSGREGSLKATDCSGDTQSG